MAGKNIFDEPFDDGTKAKLEIFKQYFQEWLPVFVSAKTIYWENVQVFDFFSGEGSDCTGYHGSPLIILDTANSLEKDIMRNRINLQLFFNEISLASYDKLNSKIEDFNKSPSYSYKTFNQDFSSLFHSHYQSMRTTANFIFLDQNGIKEITSDIFKKIIDLKNTDFLFFISSSFFKRFAETEEFKKYFPTLGDLSGIDYYHVHRKVLEYYKSLIPVSKPYYIAPFSIKKGSNIYGLIFGTNHTLGLEKFLSVAWKMDKQRGEANFDIDNERINNEAPSLFAQFNVPTKRQVFEKNLTDNILNLNLTSNREVYLYALSEGFLLKDVNVILKKLKSENKIDFDFKLISSDLHKEKDIKAIKII